METVKLRNGAEEAKVAVITVMMAVNGLDPITRYELVMKCRNCDHKLFGNTREKLQQLALVGPDGRVHETIRNIVVSSAEGDGMAMTFGSPVAEEGDKA